MFQPSLLSISDLHFDSSDEKTSLWAKTRDWIKQVLVEQPSVEKVVICGDTFHIRKEVSVRRVDQDVRSLINMISDIRPDLYTHIVLGNHDFTNRNDRISHGFNLMESSKNYDPGYAIYKDITFIENFSKGFPALMIPWYDDDRIILNFLNDELEKFLPKNRWNELMIFGHMAINGTIMSGASISSDLTGTVYRYGSLNISTFSSYKATFLGHFHFRKVYQGFETSTVSSFDYKDNNILSTLPGFLMYVGSPFQMSKRETNDIHKGLTLYDPKSNLIKFEDNPSACRYIQSTVHDLINYFAKTPNQEDDTQLLPPIKYWSQSEFVLIKNSNDQLKDIKKVWTKLKDMNVLKISMEDKEKKINNLLVAKRKKKNTIVVEEEKKALIVDEEEKVPELKNNKPSLSDQVQQYVHDQMNERSVQDEKLEDVPIYDTVINMIDAKLVNPEEILLFNEYLGASGIEEWNPKQCLTQEQLFNYYQTVSVAKEEVMKKTISNSFKMIELNFENFLHTTKPINILFDKLDYHSYILSGANGSGKSLVAEAVYFVLTGSLLRWEGKLKHEDVINLNLISGLSTQKKGRVCTVIELKFQKNNGDIYIVRREHIYSKTNTNTIPKVTTCISMKRNDNAFLPIDQSRIYEIFGLFEPGEKQTAKQMDSFKGILKDLLNFSLPWGYSASPDIIDRSLRSYILASDEYKLVNEFGAQNINNMKNMEQNVKNLKKEFDLLHKSLKNIQEEKKKVDESEMNLQSFIKEIISTTYEIEKNGIEHKIKLVIQDIQSNENKIIALKNTLEILLNKNCDDEVEKYRQQLQSSFLLGNNSDKLHDQMKQMEMKALFDKQKNILSDVKQEQVNLSQHQKVMVDLCDSALVKFNVDLHKDYILVSHSMDYDDIFQKFNELVKLISSLNNIDTDANIKIVDIKNWIMLLEKKSKSKTEQVKLSLENYLKPSTDRALQILNEAESIKTFLIKNNILLSTDPISTVTQVKQKILCYEQKQQEEILYSEYKNKKSLIESCESKITQLEENQKELLQKIEAKQIEIETERNNKADLRLKMLKEEVNIFAQKQKDKIQEEVVDKQTELAQLEFKLKSNHELKNKYENDLNLISDDMINGLGNYSEEVLAPKIHQKRSNHAELVERFSLLSQLQVEKETELKGIVVKIYELCNQFAVMYWWSKVIVMNASQSVNKLTTYLAEYELNRIMNLKLSYEAKFYACDTLSSYELLNDSDLQRVPKTRVTNHLASTGERRRQDFAWYLAVSNLLSESYGITFDILFLDELFMGVDGNGLNALTSAIETYQIDSINNNIPKKVFIMCQNVLIPTSHNSEVIDVLIDPHSGASIYVFPISYYPNSQYPIPHFYEESILYQERSLQYGIQNINLHNNKTTEIPSQEILTNVDVKKRKSNINKKEEKKEDSDNKNSKKKSKIIK